jgi:hypothetical protein
MDMDAGLRVRREDTLRETRPVANIMRRIGCIRIPHRSANWNGGTLANCAQRREIQIVNPREVKKESQYETDQTTCGVHARRHEQRHRFQR